MMSLQVDVVSQARAYSRHLRKTNGQYLKKERNNCIDFSQIVTYQWRLLIDHFILSSWVVGQTCPGMLTVLQNTIVKKVLSDCVVSLHLV